MIFLAVHYVRRCLIIPTSYFILPIYVVYTNVCICFIAALPCASVSIDKCQQSCR